MNRPLLTLAAVTLAVIGMIVPVSVLAQNQNYEAGSYSNYTVALVNLSNALPTIISQANKKRVSIEIINITTNPVCIGTYYATNGVTNITLTTYGASWHKSYPERCIARIVGRSGNNSSAAQVNVIEGIQP